MAYKFQLGTFRASGSVIAEHGMTGSEGLSANDQDVTNVKTIHDSFHTAIIPDPEKIIALYIGWRIYLNGPCVINTFPLSFGFNVSWLPKNKYTASIKNIISRKFLNVGFIIIFGISIAFSSLMAPTQIIIVNKKPMGPTQKRRFNSNFKFILFFSNLQCPF